MILSVSLSDCLTQVEIRLQLNILLRKVAGIEYLFKDVPEVMFPVLWFEVMPKVMSALSRLSH